MRSEHPIEQEIEYVVIAPGTEHIVEVGARLPEVHKVGDSGVTRIEACTKSGMHTDIPYIRVWAADKCVGEWCQHNIIGVYFKTGESS